MYSYLEFLGVAEVESEAARLEVVFVMAVVFTTGPDLVLKSSTMANSGLIKDSCSGSGNRQYLSGPLAPFCMTSGLPFFDGGTRWSGKSSGKS